MGACDFLGKGESETEAGAGASIFCAVEAVEEFFSHFGGNVAAVVSYFYNVYLGVFGRDRDVNGAASGTVFEGVGEEVEEKLSQ